MNITPGMFKVFLTLVLGCIAVDAFAATTYYVRMDGGTSAQCTGTTNAAYSGSGTSQPCAFNHPAWALGTYGNSGRMAGGDTLIIEDTNPANGQQAQYMVGFGMPNTVSANCNLYSPYDCTLNAIPSGPSAANPTIIAGSEYLSGCNQKPQLWGTESVKQVLNVSASNIRVECMEITDHSNCGFRVGSPQCAERYNGTSNGTYARNGVYGMGGSNNTFRNLDVHGFSNRGFLMGGVNNLTMSYVNMDGNYMANWDGDVGASSSFSGTILLDHLNNRFAGCSESYPRSATFSNANYSNCTDQNDNPPGYGDGIGMYNTGGDWIFRDSNISFNGQDGLDLLYHNGTGSVTIERSLFEANNGNQLKVTAPNVSIDNSIMIANCNYLSMNGKVKNTSTWTNCRAGGDNVVLTPGLGGTYKISNSTLYSDGNSEVLLVNRLGICNGSERYTFRNNIIVGNGTSALYLNELGGACASAPFDTDYSIIRNVSNSACPAGVHNMCSMNPGWVGSIDQHASTNVPNVMLQYSSPAVAHGIVLPDVSALDFTSGNRGSIWDIGALQYATSGPSAPVVSITSPSNGSSFVANSNITISANASQVNGTITMVDFYNGTTLLGSSSSMPYNFTWNNVPAGNYTLTAKATGSNGVPTTSNPVSIVVNPPASNIPPTVNLTAPLSNATFTGPVNVTISANASDADGSIARVEFFNGATQLSYIGTSAPYTYVMNNVQPGVYTITARATDNRDAVTTSAPVTFTVNAPASNIPPTVSIISPTSNALMIGPLPVNLAFNAADSDGTITNIEIYNGTARLGYVYNSAAPVFNYTWNNVQIGTYTMTVRVTDNNGATTTSSPVMFSVITQPLNIPPTVSMTSPTNNASMNGPLNVTVSANAADFDGSIARVEFFNGSVQLGSAITTAPYSFTWNNVQPGSYTVTARATDNNNAVTMSAPVSFVVNAVNMPPTVSLTSPSASASLTAPASVMISANAADSDGSIARVEFFNGSTSLGYVGTSAPYTFNWNNVSAGTYVITARATDNRNAVTISAPVTIVVAEQSAPVVTITSPSSNATYTVPAGITLTSSVAGSNGATLLRVAYYAGVIYLGESNSAPYTVQWNSASAGNYALTARAIYSNGTVITSAARNITVNAHTAPTVSIVTPVNNASYSRPAHIVLTSNAVANGGSITKVDYYRNNLYIGTSYSSPYTFDIWNLQRGTYTLRAKATDSMGFETNSSQITVRVN